jgi:DNA-binding response OmpR family regulator
LSDVLLLTGAPESSADILPSLSLLPHTVRLAPAEAAAVTGGPPADVVLIDARRDLMQAKALFQLLHGTTIDVPMLAVVAEGGWAAITADWGADDVILHSAGPGEIEARLRLAIGRRSVAALAPAGEIRAGELVIDEASYLARLRGRSLDLTFKEFELLKFLAQHPARVFTRSQLLQEVWGYDYFGGTRTVDVHVRRLRAKLGAEHELLIGTVRNVGYRFVPAQGKAGVPAQGKAGVPAQGSTGGPAHGSTGVPAHGSTGVPAQGKAGGPAQGSTGGPARGKTSVRSGPAGTADEPDRAADTSGLAAHEPGAAGSQRAGTGEGNRADNHDSWPAAAYRAAASGGPRREVRPAHARR